MRAGYLIWCEKRDLNPYGKNHTPLKRARLPVPPLSRATILLYHNKQDLSSTFANFFDYFWRGRPRGQRSASARKHADEVNGAVRAVSRSRGGVPPLAKPRIILRRNARRLAFARPPGRFGGEPPRAKSRFISAPPLVYGSSNIHRRRGCPRGRSQGLFLRRRRRHCKAEIGLLALMII